MTHATSLIAAVLAFAPILAFAEQPIGRRPLSEESLRYWLLNMQRHEFTEKEVAEGLAMSSEEVAKARQQLRLAKDEQLRGKSETIEFHPYPGGRHPRIGFLDGAVNPQRETKVSVFLPWDRTKYVVVDLPEAIWSNLGLTYLAHTHVPTIWSKQGIELKQLEWERGDDGSLSLTRKLPNGIEYTAQVEAAGSALRMKLSLTNGTKERLSDLRIQNCVMLKGAKGFDKQTNDNKRFESPFVAVHADDGNRWIITAWERCHRAWGNAPCPCLHSDPKFADLDPGESQTITGWLWFYEGDEIDVELARLKKQTFSE